MGEKLGRDAGTRRAFLRRLVAVGGGLVGGIALTAAGCAPAAQGSAAAAGAVAERPLGVQLYTVRDLLQSDFEGTLARVAEIGYKEVEFAGLYGRSPEQVRATLDRLGLRAPSTHIGIEQLRRDLNGTLAAAQTLGHRYVIVPYLAEQERTVEGYRRVAAELNRFGAAARERGMRIGYHNHAFEFEPLAGGQTGFDILLRETDPALVDFELDLYWAVHAGQDPVQIFNRHPGRFPLWHVKDMTGIGGAKAMVPVGAGEIDFRNIFANAQRSGMRHFFVEHDNAAQTTGSLESIRTSYGNLRQMLR